MTIHDRIRAIVDRQEAKGLTKYGEPLDENTRPHNWAEMLAEELIDGACYALKMGEMGNAERETLATELGRESAFSEMREELSRARSSAEDEGAHALIDELQAWCAAKMRGDL